MNRSFFIVSLVLCSLLFSGCKKKQAEQPPSSPATQQETVTSSAPLFVPPADSVITLETLTLWYRCNPLLDSLTFRYADSFKTDDASALLRYQEDFTNAQNRICIRAGLSGGYPEYKWILQNMGLEKNRAALEALKGKKF